MSCVKWNANGSIEEFTSPAPIRGFVYSFIFLLYVFDPDKDDFALVTRRTITNRSALQAPNSLINARVSDYSRSTSPMKMYVSDTTNYVPGQPLLELLAVLELQTGTTSPPIPLSFKTGRTRVSDHRQIMMPLPPLIGMTISFNLDALQIYPM